ncbi:MAG: hypothetical protein BWY54_00723 [Candidatus Dependentiae bacterium ADurb.Bin331]|nr:MAG: hypothetical protein BWY54_00723 [Candidatus Dependentiae bacterium ADurb.Bin331]
MSPLPTNLSAPAQSKIIRESILEATLNAIRLGKLTLIIPVITSTDGRCVATIKCIPAARAICAKRAMRISTSLPATIIKSESSSMITTINGNFSNCGSFLQRC